MSDLKLKDKILSFAKEDGYEGELSPSAVEECASVYSKYLDEDGDEKVRFWRAPNGKKSNLSRFLWILVRTDSFKKWFGKSVIVDENGDPRVMYHGAADSFSEFKPEFIGVEKSKMTLWSGPGFYFTDKRKVAVIYGKKGGTIMDVFLRLENPLVVDETGNAEKYSSHITIKQAVDIMLSGDNTQWLDSTICGDLSRLTGKNRREFKEMTRKERVEAYVKELKTDVVKLKCVTSAFGAKSQKKMLNAICRYTGHDGVIHKLAPGVTEWVVYDPSAIKSASNNDGDFSRTKASVEDAAYLGEENTNLKGKKSMLSGIIDSLKKLREAPATDHEVAQDIIDRHGRHHQPKAIPEGGQYEEEGQYLHGQAKVDAALRKMTHGKHASVLRDHVAPLYAAMGKDSMTRAKIQAMHEDIRGLSKHALLRGMARHLKDAKKHAEAYEEVKDMNKEEFKNWLQAHPEYAHDINTKLLNESRYNGQREVKGGFHDDGTGHQKHEAWEEAKWSVGAKAMASMILFQEHADALSGAPDQIMANAIEHALQEQEGQGEIREPAQQHISESQPQVVPEEERRQQALQDVMVRTEGLIGITTGQPHIEVPFEGRTHFVPTENISAIAERLGEDHPFVRNMREIAARSVTTPVQPSQSSEPTSASTPAPSQMNAPSHSESVSNEQADRMATAVEYVTRDATAEYPVRRDGESDIDYANRVMSYNYSNPDAVGILPEVNAILQAARGGATQHEIGQRLADMVAHNFSWETTYAENVASDIISAMTGVSFRERLGGHGVRVEEVSHQGPDGHEHFGNEDGLMAVNLPGLGRFMGRVDGTSSIAESQFNTPATGTYTDRDGNSHEIVHNDGGLKGTIHQSEIGAVQAEMREAFNAAREGDSNAAYYAHALSHFLGRGNDERSPHPGMRQEGLLKHQLADKMVKRLEAKQNALENARNGGDEEDIAEATDDLEATRKACRTIAEKCGITADMLPEDHSLRGVIGGSASERLPQHQNQSATATAESSSSSGAYTPTSQEIEDAAMAFNSHVGPMMTDMSLSRHNINEALAGRGAPLVLEAISNSIPHSSRIFQEIARANGFEPDAYGEGPTTPQSTEHASSRPVSGRPWNDDGTPNMQHGAWSSWPNDTDIADAAARSGMSESELREALSQRVSSDERNRELEMRLANTLGEGHIVTQAIVGNTIPDGFGQIGAYPQHIQTSGVTPVARRSEEGGFVDIPEHSSTTTAQPPRATNPQHQPLVDALHNLANPTPTQEPVEQPTAQTQETATATTEPTEEQINQAVASLNSSVGVENGDNHRALIQRALQDPTGTGAPAVDYMRRHLGEEHPLVQMLNARVATSEPTSANEPAQSAEPQSQLPDGLTDENISDAISRLQNTERGRGISREQFESNIRRILSGERQFGNREQREQQMQILNEALGSDHTVTRALQAIHDRETAAELPPMPSEAEINSLADSVADHTATGGIVNRDRVRRVLTEIANGTFAPTYANGTTADDILNSYSEHLGLADNPVFQAIRARHQALGNNGGAQPQSQTTQPQTTAAPQPTGNASHLGEVVNADGTRTYNFGRTRQMGRYSHYEWPVRRGQTITREQITPELIDGIVSNLPTGRRAWGHRYIADRIYGALQNPSADFRAHNIIQKMMQSNNTHARRFQQVLNALHPDYVQRFQEQERRRAGRQATIELTRNYEANTNRPNIPMNVSDEDYANAVNTIVGRVGEENRSMIESAMQEFRSNGTVSESQANQLAQYLGEDNPVVREARRVFEARRSTAERERSRIEQNRPHLHPVVPAQDVQNADKALAEQNGIVYKGAGTPMVMRSGARRFHSGHSNCWHNANSIIGQLRGLDMFPKNNGHDLMSFGNTKNAMSKAYERVDKTSNRRDTVQWLNNTHFSNGDTISAWSGGHNVVFAYNNGQWYKYDGYYREFGRAVSVESMASQMSHTTKDVINLDNTYGYYNGSAENGRYKHMVLNMAKREIRKDRNDMRYNPTDAEIVDKAKDILARSQGSYLIRINQPLIKEMLISNQS